MHNARKYQSILEQRRRLRAMPHRAMQSHIGPSLGFLQVNCRLDWSRLSTTSVGADSLLLEDGDHLLLEDGGKVLLE